MHVHRRKLMLMMVLLFSTLLCGFIFHSSEMTLDTEKNIVYQKDTVDKILEDFSSNHDFSKDKYNKTQVVLLGKLSEIAKKHNAVTLVSVSGTQTGTVKCSSSDADVIACIETLSVGDVVKVYGEFSISLIGSHLTMEVSKIEKTTDDAVSGPCFSLLNGKTMDREKMFVRTLAGDKITYYIPEAWLEAEYLIADNELGSIEGYQYRLNEIPSSAAVQPESFFVCYFDNKLLKKSSDKSKTELIERAIIANILKKNPDSLDKFPAKKVNTYYGARYQYYQDAYQDILGEGHHVEFVFQPVDTEGIIVYLYVYSDANHVDDIMFLMRLLEIS